MLPGLNNVRDEPLSRQHFKQLGASIVRICRGRSLRPTALASGVATRRSLDVFSFQLIALPVLLGWSLGSILTGLIWCRGRGRLWRGFGEQFIGWGLVDGLIALAGLRGARRASVSEIEPQAHNQQRRLFFWLLGANTLLDAGYIWGGRRVVRGAGDDEKRRGMGWGIIVQGSFLLVWDAVLMILLNKAVDER